MIWLFLLLRKTYNARTGFVHMDCPYGCPSCGAQCTGRVFAEGFGTYQSAWGHVANGFDIAQGFASQNYYHLVRSLLGSAACPACGRFAPVLVSQTEHQAAIRVDRATSRFIWAGTAAGVVLVLLLGGALYDKSGWLALLGLSLAVACGLLVLHARTPNGLPLRLSHPRNVSFYWQDQWVVPNTTYAPSQDTPVARSGLFSGLTYGGACVAGLAAVTTLVTWASGFQTLRVVNMEDAAIHIVVDDEPLGDVTTHVEATADAPQQTFSLRSGSHVIEAFSADNVLIERRTIDFHAFDRQWIFAPRPRLHNACLATVVTTYSKYGSAPAPVITPYPPQPFTTRVDDALVGSPTSVTMDQNTSETTRTALRVFDCSTMDDEPASFATRPRH